MIYNYLDHIHFRNDLTTSPLTRSEVIRINRYMRGIDESNLYPIMGKFNVTERAIRKLRKLQASGLNANTPLGYFLALDNLISYLTNREV